jgi:hypothetical protein
VLVVTNLGDDIWLPFAVPFLLPFVASKQLIPALMPCFQAKCRSLLIEEVLTKTDFRRGYEWVSPSALQ